MKFLAANANHKYAIITLIQQYGPLSRIDLAHRMSVSPSTVTLAVNALIRDGLVVETTLKRKKGSGRPPVAISLVPGAGAAIGIEMAFEHVRGVIVDLHYGILAGQEIELGSDYAVSSGIDAVFEIVESLKRQSGFGDKDLLGIGVGLATPINRQGRPVRSSMLPRWSGADVHALLAARTSVPLVIENDTRLSARGERVWGAARGVDDFVYLKLHYGVGGAVVASSVFITGKDGGAGEVGHISLDPEGPLCRCGRRGCLETYASIQAVLERIQPVHPGIDLEGLLALSAAGDPAVRTVLADAGEKVAQVAAILCNALNPELILIGGGLAGAGQVFIDGIKAGMQPLVVELNRSPRVEIGALGSNASALGGAARVFELHTGNQLADAATA